LREEKSSRGRRSKKEQRLDSRMPEKDSPKNKWKNARASRNVLKLRSKAFKRLTLWTPLLLLLLQIERIKELPATTCMQAFKLFLQTVYRVVHDAHTCI